ncbi:hypothetical protein C8039_18510 [Halogeometricum sp. wsp3]|nr:hypothetical protein C8039_18510 [Halogeometricum sp. wsp3]
MIRSDLENGAILSRRPSSRLVTERHCKKRDVRLLTRIPASHRVDVAASVESPAQEQHVAHRRVQRLISLVSGGPSRQSSHASTLDAPEYTSRASNHSSLEWLAAVETRYLLTTVKPDLRGG